MSLKNNSVNWKQVDKWVERTGLKMVWQPYGMPDVMDPHKSAFSDVHPMPRWDFPQKVFVSAAINGAFFTKDGNPNQAMTPAEISRSAQECIDAGAPVIHIHVRDEKGFNVLSHGLFEDVIAPLRQANPGIAVDACLVAVNEHETEQMKSIMKSGLLDAVPVNATSVILGDNMFAKTPHGMIEKTRLAMENGMKPQIAVYTDADVDNARRFLIDSGLLEKPYMWAIVPALPGCSPMYSPESMIDGLMRMVRLIREVDKDSIITLCSAGRASTHVAALALLMGLHVRTGMEDTVWKWPHRDDMITNNAEQWSLVAGIARSLGRDIMTSDEYRSLVGMPELMHA